MPGGLWGACQAPPGGPSLNQGQLSNSPIAVDDIVENFIVIQLIFAGIIVPQEFTIMTAPGISGPTNTCVKGYQLYH